MNPDLVVRGKDGKPYSVRYEAVNAMLLNEFLKEHRKVEKLEQHTRKLTQQSRKRFRAIQSRRWRSSGTGMDASPQIQSARIANPEGQRPGGDEQTAPQKS